MNVALVGFGVENQATYRYFKSKGITPTVCDQNPHLTLPPDTPTQLGPEYLDNLDRFDVIVRSVGINPTVILESNPEIKERITTAVNIFFEECKTPIIGVTGTKGKGTTSTLIHKILLSSGKKSVIAGNIGLSMLDILNESESCEYVVLELSSFQLYDVKFSPNISVCLMVVPEHLDWHSDPEDYIFAKKNLFRYQNKEDVAIFNGFNEASIEIASISAAETKIKYGVPHQDEDTYGCTVYEKNGHIWHNGQEIMHVGDIKLLGRHNVENVCAAIAATWDITNENKDAIRQVAKEFTGLPYRLEFIREINGVKYYNDSFATTPETAIAALNSFEQPVISILGGSDKGVSFDELADEIVKKNTKHVFAIGERGPIIADLLRQRGYKNITDTELYTMQDIVNKASAIAEPGDIVLLSTGCASFGMFKNYKDRGNQFNEAVLSLDEVA